MNSTIATRNAKMNKWALIVRECKLSGEETNTWPKDHGVNRNTCYYWHRKPQDKCFEELVAQNSELSAPTFVELPAPVKKTRPVLSTLEVVMHAK